MSETGKISEAVADVESKLAAFWSAPDTTKAGEHVAKVRASTTNFAVVAGTAELDRLRAATAELAETHAGRAFLLTVDGRLAPWEVETAVDAVCRTDGAVPICYDRVEIGFGAMAAGRAASLVQALALSEVPLAVEIARGAPGPLVYGLLKAADRIIVDTTHTSVVRIAEIAPSIAAPIADRAFVRTFVWRDLVARFFDEEPSALAQIESIEITRTPGAKEDPAALFLGWLASRLGWTFVSKTRAERVGKAIAISVRDGQVAGVEPGELTGVHIRTRRRDAAVELECVRSAARAARWTVRGDRAEEHEHALGSHDETWVLVKALDATESDRVYREAVIAAAAWSRSA